MPIGSLLINRLRKGTKVFNSTDTQERKILELEKDALGLLDGQQRTLAMLLGWPSEKEDDGACIWVDLGERGHDGAPFELRISTLSQPFGFQRHTHKKFSMQDRREARTARFPDVVAELSDQDIAKNICLKEIRPWKGKKAEEGKGDLLLYPLQDLWRVWLDNHTRAGEWSITLPKLEEALSAPDGEVKERFGRLCSAFERIYHRAQIPLVMYENLEPEDKSENPAQHPLVVLFNRISTGGERLSPADLLFAMIKQVWPDAHTLVEELHVTNVKHLMTANDFVMTAFRLALLECRQPKTGEAFEDSPDPGASEFQKRLGVVLGDDKNPGPLRKYIMTGSPLGRAFNIFYELLIYRSEAADDKGISKLMMPFLPRPLIQVLVFWVMRQLRAGKTHEELMQSRSQVISFVLFWYLCATLDPNRASKECIKQIMDTPEHANFPGTALYSALTKTDESVKKYASALPMSPVKTVEGIFEASPSGRLRSFVEKFSKLSNSGSRKSEVEIKKEEQINNLCQQMIARFWRGKDLLLWLQRGYLSKRFDSYDALAGKEDKETVPYDYDHLCPCDEWGAYSNKIENRSPESGLSTENRGAFMKHRHEIGNGIGNYHILHFADNRSVSNASFLEKVKLLEEGRWRLIDGALPIQDKALWDKTSNLENKYCWTDERVMAWQEAVDRRFMHLYGLYYAAVEEIVSSPSSPDRAYPVDAYTHYR